jgi:exopolysaccharide biosynthesis protein
MHDGKLVHNNVLDLAVNIVGFNDQGKLVIGEMTAKELVEKNMREVVTFEPNLIVEGEPVVKGNGGQGVAPLTGIGQMADGTVIFVVIDGRRPMWSIGATLRDLMNVFEDYHAVNAANLDGGSSAELVYNGKVMNRPCDIFGERYIPTAFVVTP